MARVMKLTVAVILMALGLSSCKSGCDCYKHSYGTLEQQDSTVEVHNA